MLWGLGGCSELGSLPEAAESFCRPGDFSGSVVCPLRILLAIDSAWTEWPRPDCTFLVFQSDLQSSLHAWPSRGAFRCQGFADFDMFGKLYDELARDAFSPTFPEAATCQNIRAPARLNQNP